MRTAVICATVLSVAMVAAVLVSDLFLRPENPSLAEEWDDLGGLVIGMTGFLIVVLFIRDRD